MLLTSVLTILSVKFIKVIRLFRIFINLILIIIMKVKMYAFASSDKRDKLSQVTIFSTNQLRAYALAVINFAQNGYKGEPVELNLCY